MVSPPAPQQKDPGFNLAAAFVWILNVLAVSAWVRSVYCSFPQPKNMHSVRSVGESKLPVDVNVYSECLSMCYPCDRLVTCPWLYPFGC